MKKFVKPVAKPEQVPPMNPPPMPPKAARPPSVPAPASRLPSPMARPPVAKTSRQVPAVATGRGVVRTDTHNQANQLPPDAKHKGRGM